MKRRIKLFLLWRCWMPGLVRRWYWRHYGPKTQPFETWPEQSRARFREWVAQELRK